MVNLQFCNESKIHSSKLSAASCSDEVGRDSIKRNGSSHHSSKVPEVNGDCKVSLEDTPLVNGSCRKMPANGFPTMVGYCDKLMSGKNGQVVNGNCSSNEPVNDLKTDNQNHDKISVELPRINGNYDKVVAEELPTVNGTHDEVAVELLMLNGNHDDEVAVQPATVIGSQDDKITIEKLTTLKGNQNHEFGVEELPTVVETYNKDINNSSTPSEKGIVQNETEENTSGFVTVVNKKKHKRNRNRKKPIFNLPIKKTESIHRDNGIDKNHNVKTSPAHSTQKPPSRTVFPVRSSEKSYSSALVNGQSKMSQMKSASQISSDSQNKAFSDVTKGPKVNKSADNNPELSETCISPGQLSVVTNDTSAVSCQPNSATKVEKTDFSGQTDIRSLLNDLDDLSLSSSLPSQEDTVELSINSTSPVYFVDIDYIKECSAIIAETNTSYCDSVISNDSGRGDSEGYCDATFRCQFPKLKVPLLIGRHGSYKKEVEGKSGAKIRVINLFNKDLDFAIVEIKGTLPQIEKAKLIIQERFPNILLEHCFDIAGTEAISPYYIATLPEGTSFSGIVSSMYNPTYFWVQQYGHPLAYHLEDLERKMSLHYNHIPDAPIVDYPVPGQIVAVAGSTDCNNDARWLRGMIVNVLSGDGNVVVKYLDHGGEYEIPVTGIRQMRHEFFTMPFFAAECALYGVIPAGDVWSPEVFQEFMRLCYVSHHLIFRVIEKTPERYYVAMQTYDCTVNAMVDFATVLIEKGLAVPYTERTMYQPPNALEQ